MDDRVTGRDGSTNTERFWSKVDKAPTDGQGCWEWKAGLSEGYGRFDRTAFGTSLAHRISWMLRFGPIPEGFQLDHLCRNRACVNPAHLEPVTPLVNKKRGQAGVVRTLRAQTRPRCNRGHPLVPGNLSTAPAHVAVGSRRCLECRTRSREAYKARKRALATSA